jgi:hypothetical protein
VTLYLLHLAIEWLPALGLILLGVGIGLSIGERRVKRAERFAFRACLREVGLEWRNNPKDSSFWKDAAVDAALKAAKKDSKVEKEN